MNIRNKKKMEIVIRIMMAKNEIINEHCKNATYLNINRKSRENINEKRNKCFNESGNENRNYC